MTSDAAILYAKTGNAVILRGGSEAIHSNLAIAAAPAKWRSKAGLPNDSIQLVPLTDREGVRLLAEMDRYVDLIIPRGGKALIEAVVDAARMPVIKHSGWNLHRLCRSRGRPRDGDRDCASTPRPSGPECATRSRPSSFIARC